MRALNLGTGAASPVSFFGSSFFGGGGGFSAFSSGLPPSFSMRRLMFVSWNFMSYATNRIRTPSMSTSAPSATEKPTSIASTSAMLMLAVLDLESSSFSSANPISRICDEMAFFFRSTSASIDSSFSKMPLPLRNSTTFLMRNLRLIQSPPKITTSGARKWRKKAKRYDRKPKTKPDV